MDVSMLLDQLPGDFPQKLQAAASLSNRACRGSKVSRFLGRSEDAKRTFTEVSNVGE